MISDGFIAVVESNPSLRRFINILRSGTSIVGKIISEPKLANIEIKIHQLIPILSVSKVAVKIYKQNVLSLKVNEQDS